MDYEKLRMKELRQNIKIVKKELDQLESEYEYKLSLLGLIDVWSTELTEIKKRRQYRANKRYNESKRGKEKNRQRALKRWRKLHDVKKPRANVGLVVFQ